MVDPCFIVHYLVSSFTIISLGKLFNFSCLLMSFDSLSSLSLPHGVMGWSAVCVIVAFPCHTH